MKDSRPRDITELRPARRGGGRRLTFDNARTENYEAVFVQHSAGEWDRILIARDDGTIAQWLVDLINGTPTELVESIERIRVHHDKTLGHSPTNRIGYCAEPDGISATYCETGILLAGLR